MPMALILYQLDRKEGMKKKSYLGLGPVYPPHLKNTLILFFQPGTLSLYRPISYSFVVEYK